MIGADSSGIIKLTSKIGDVANGNYTVIEKDGTIQTWGDGTAWDDLSGALAGARLDRASGRLDIDWFNGGVNFNANARYPEEPVIIPVQAKHSMICLLYTSPSPRD